MRKSEARAANNKIVRFHYTPLTDAARALAHADKLKDAFNDVVVTHVGDKITVTARNTWREGKNDGS